jgi:CubicO group peptidase (beta-lactamase class C family)
MVGLGCSTRGALISAALVLQLASPAGAAALSSESPASGHFATHAQIESYFRPFAATNNLSGSVLIRTSEKILFAKSYGFADTGVRNGPKTRFHVASMSIPFTSTAVLRLIDQGKLTFDTRVSDIVPGVPNGDKITIRNLVLQNSNLPDFEDDVPNSDDMRKSRQTPQSMVDAIRPLPPHGEPGGESKGEEHSGQNVLALIIEKKTGLPFADAMQRLVFGPFGMRDSGIDDDRPIHGPVARGYVPSGTFGLTPGPTIHWSALPGNGSAYTTTADVWRWIQGVVRGPLLSEGSRAAMVGMMGTDQAFGWWTAKSERLGETVYQTNGRAPGFSAFFEYLPKENLAVILLANMEHDANPEIAAEAAVMVMGKTSYKGFDYKPIPVEVAGHPSGDFTFGPDFYRPSGTLKLVSDANGVTIYWPQRPVAPLLPIGKDKFKDRYYWTDVTVVRDSEGKPVELDYGLFKGVRADHPDRTNN